jgi:hypothetical protein
MEYIVERLIIYLHFEHKILGFIHINLFKMFSNNVLVLWKIHNRIYLHLISSFGIPGEIEMMQPLTK